MRELTQDEMAQVVGGDGFNVGKFYVSGTRATTGILGVAGAVSTAFQGGFLLGTGINMASGAMFDLSLSDRAGGFIYEHS